MKTRKLVSLFVLSLICANTLFSTSNSNGANSTSLVNEKNLNITDIKNEYEKIVENNSYKELVYEIVPYPFAKYFYEETKNNNIDLNLILLSIAKYESGWNVFIHKKNKDSSIDYGPMGLNSKNIMNPWFIEQFFPKDIKMTDNNKNIVYMIACIRFFKSLYDKHTKENAIMIYNAGYTRIKKGDIPPITKKYLAMIREYYNMYFNMYINIYNKNYLAGYEEYIKDKMQSSYKDNFYVKINKEITYIDINRDIFKPYYIIYAKEKKFYVELQYTIIPNWFDIIISINTNTNNNDDNNYKYIIHIYNHIG